LLFGGVIPILVTKIGIDNISFINDNNRMYEIRHYLTEDNKDVYLEWLKIQRDMVAKIAIVKRINRVELGNFGDHAFCRDGVWEMRIDVGAGYRVYYAVSGKDIVLLLCGGNKRTQTADINRACEYWGNWKKENGK
jgi:putative addiction module killer protein